MLFGVTHGELTGILGEDRVATVPANAFPPAVADTEGARFLQTVGVPTGTLALRQPEEPGGRLPLVRDAVHLDDFEDLPQEAGDWPVIGRLLNAHLALDPGSGAVYALDADEQSAQQLHTDVSSLAEVALRFQRLLGEFSFGDDEEAGFERLEGDVDRIREETGDVDPLPFRDDETVWSVVGDEIAMGQRFTGDSPGGRSLYG
ncbi:SUKH-4 family immunity protein [Streptomyces sp. NPDC059597]|uniref:SUKH-4 family immunity protein n=1 Tax=Streptomyces sp. NPDC059597 TaxID=3346879 RepID=UPI00369F5DAF